VSADQTAPYTPKPITQRDGSALANSNCRMASIATGLDYETGGGKTSSGSAMRASQDDQSGGTDSGDAKQAWSRGYAQTLIVRDGATFDQALADLRSGALVHLDVWHAATGGPCLSGTGAYGHTMAVLPDCSSGSWLVADPWCSPPKWSRVAEAKLRQGAEEWGRRVYGAARSGTTGGPGLADDDDALRDLVRRLMSASFPGHERPIRDYPETRGPQPILFTITHPQEVEAVSIPVVSVAPELADVSEGVQLYEPGTTQAALRMPQTRTGMRVPMVTRSPSGTAMPCVVYTRPEPDPDVLLAVYNGDARNRRPDPAYAGGGSDDESIRRERDQEWIDALTTEWPVQVEPMP